MTAPIRWVLRRQKNVTTLLGTVETIDRRNRSIRVVGEGDPIHYDYLIVATGARLVHDSIPGLAEGSFGFYSLGDAERLREELRAQEDAAILQAVRLQEAAGLRSI